MLSTIIIQRIEETFGQPIRYPKDCEALAAQISEQTKKSISGSTLKRLFGLVEGIREPRLYTLDTIAFYLGFQTWEALINDFKNEQYSGFDAIQEVHAEELKEGEKLRIKYDPERELVLECIAPCKFKIEQSVNSKLQQNDTIQIKSITKAYPLFINNVVRENKNLGQYVAGKLSGITHIEKL